MFPVWCGDDQCHAAPYNCPSAPCDLCGTPGPVCVYFNQDYACCPSADYPVWCGGGVCYSEGYECPSYGDPGKK